PNLSRGSRRHGRGDRIGIMGCGAGCDPASLWSLVRSQLVCRDVHLHEPAAAGGDAFVVVAQQALGRYFRRWYIFSCSSCPRITPLVGSSSTAFSKYVIAVGS